MSFFDRLTTPVTPIKALDVQAITTPVNGDGIDVTDADAVNFTVLATAYTSGTMTFKLQESPDNSNWTDIDSKYVINEFAQLDVLDKVVNIGLSGLDDANDKYVRLVTVGTVVLSAVAIACICKGNR